MYARTAKRQKRGPQDESEARNVSLLSYGARTSQAQRQWFWPRAKAAAELCRQTNLEEECKERGYSRPQTASLPLIGVEWAVGVLAAGLRPASCRQAVGRAAQGDLSSDQCQTPMSRWPQPNIHVNPWVCRLLPPKDQEFLSPSNLTVELSAFFLGSPMEDWQEGHWQNVRVASCWGGCLLGQDLSKLICVHLM